VEVDPSCGFVHDRPGPGPPGRKLARNSFLSWQMMPLFVGALLSVGISLPTIKGFLRRCWRLRCKYISCALLAPVRDIPGKEKQKKGCEVVGGGSGRLTMIEHQTIKHPFTCLFGIIDVVRAGHRIALCRIRPAVEQEVNRKVRNWWSCSAYHCRYFHSL
jgi:hypothetical protein